MVNFVITIQAVKDVSKSPGLMARASRAVDRTAGIFSHAVFVLALAVSAAVVFLAGRARLEPVAAPPAWAARAEATDRLRVPGHSVAYWGNPDAPYGFVATKRKSKPIAVVVHFTRVKPVLRLVSYGHGRDFSRGGHAYGYHFYVGRGGGIAQGAPLSKRTNHIKSKRRPQRTRTGRHLWSGNSIGITLVGGCDWLLRPRWRRFYTCAQEFTTERQLRAGLALIRALQAQYGIDCGEVYGHGELQTDRASFEGATLTRLARTTCPTQVAGTKP